MQMGKIFKSLFSTGTVEGSAEIAKATFELADALEKPEIRKLAPLIQQGGSLLEVLNSPLAELAESTLPFVKIATGLLKFALKVTKKQPTLAQTIALVSQAAYLESFKVKFLDVPQYRERLKRQGNKPASALTTQELQRLDDLELSDRQAQAALLFFQDSTLAKAYNAILIARLQELGAKPEAAQKLAKQVAQDTNRYMDAALAEMGEDVQRLREWYRGKSREEFEKYLSIDTYLEEQIKPRPSEPVFNESFTFRQIYVPLKAQRLKPDGEPDQTPPIAIEDWARQALNDDRQQDKVLFIQGNPGRGKSVFCRMFADWVRQHEHPRWTPILIRLRDVRSLAKDFEETLRKAVDRDFADNDPGWLTDRNLRFVFLLDGFDELLMEGRTSGGLEDFLRQVGRFQESCAQNSEKRHRVIITGRSLSLQSVERLMPPNLARVELLPMDDELQAQWLGQWSQLVHTNTAYLTSILQDERLPDRVRELSREPLLLYLLAAMHRDGELSVEMFEAAEGTNAKVLIYEKTLNWVLTKQRPELLNRDLTELETDGLRRILAEAGLCVVQSGGECAAIAMIEERLKGDDTARSLLEQAQTRLSESPLRNALAAFYMQPGRKGSGSVEFAHKSFSEFLCAERLKEAIEDWSTQIEVKRQQQDLIPDSAIAQQIYDLLGYGGLTPEIVEYLMALLTRSPEFNPVRLFKRLENFYLRWCDGELIDAPPENLPQKKMRLLKEQLKDSGKAIGLRQVDVYAGLNVMILLLELNRYGRSREDLKEAIVFYPCGLSNTTEFQAERLLKVIGYSYCVSTTAFRSIAGTFLSNINLSDADLSSANLSGVNLSSVNLSGAILASADLTNANLSHADLFRANLISADLSYANLQSADLSGALLYDAKLYGSNLSHANLSDATLNYANLRSTILQKANLHGASLDGANLDSSNLRNANFRSAGLRSADLGGADLGGANLRKADLSGANLSDTNLKEIFWDEGTEWDEVRGLMMWSRIPEALKQQLDLE
ncbi:MAG: pentapeptide repeat-containing protein [Drouetiella hepatica Uher 2000/2452]|uniref:Pentapeptide repeat-containing protein n=1 Tax=Drouetiella hepatica Uher 2000/2452 TaxID=904376 RepID=A0A951Q7X1_9CYAN|nr:pentapeptide repeat-containing protein [Drouetiella hepatica Uher 2000/2452]